MKGNNNNKTQILLKRLKCRGEKSFVITILHCILLLGIQRDLFNFILKNNELLMISVIILGQEFFNYIMEKESPTPRKLSSLKKLIVIFTIISLLIMPVIYSLNVKTSQYSLINTYEELYGYLNEEKLNINTNICNPNNLQQKKLYIGSDTLNEEKNYIFYFLTSMVLITAFKIIKDHE